MSRSKPFDLVSSIKVLWTNHPKNAGRDYGGTSRDLREAAEWLRLNEWQSGDLSLLSDRFNRFMDSDFDAWKEMDYPIWAFLKHYNRYAPPRITPAHRSTTMIQCERCGEIHEAGHYCGVTGESKPRNVYGLIQGINKSA